MSDAMAPGRWPPISDALVDRASAHGLTRGRAWWTRAGFTTALVFGTDAGDRWHWLPETEPSPAVWGRGVSEAEALTAALDWLDAQQVTP